MHIGGRGVRGLRGEETVLSKNLLLNMQLNPK